MVVLPADQSLAVDKLDDDAPSDPIYGNAIPRTWHWLQSIAKDGFVDFGINAMAAHLKAFREANDDKTLDALLSPTGSAPVLLPAYLDCWVQTNPAPAGDPDVALFLHGPQRDMAEVQVCWRADLSEVFRADVWTETLSLCPPTTAECLPVPLHVFRAWMTPQKKFQDLSSDADEKVEFLDRNELAEFARVPALIWNGPEKSCAAQRVGDIRPGDTIVLRAQDGGWETLGILPGAPRDPANTPNLSLDWAQLRRLDVAERGAADARHRVILRVHRALWRQVEKGTPEAELLKMATDENEEWRRSEVKELLERLLNDESWLGSVGVSEMKNVRHLADQKPSHLLIESYPNNAGFVITTRSPLPNKDAQEFETIVADPDALLEARDAIELCDHTRDVLRHVDSVLSLLPLEPWREALMMAAALHDWGKVDWRFQAMLRSTSVFAAMASSVVLAKSGVIASSGAARREVSERAELPKGFRHEMLSLQLAESNIGASALPKDKSLRALILYLITTHHGYGRPFAPVVEDNSPPDAILSMKDQQVLVTSAERLARPAHTIDSGIAERFWQLTRRHGWWGLALLETVLRLADQQASAKPTRS